MIPGLLCYKLFYNNEEILMEKASGCGKKPVAVCELCVNDSKALQQKERYLAIGSVNESSAYLFFDGVSISLTVCVTYYSVTVYRQSQFRSMH